VLQLEGDAHALLELLLESLDDIFLVFLKIWGLALVFKSRVYLSYYESF
jgi:hypothetical protein